MITQPNHKPAVQISPVDPRWLSYELRKEAWAATHPRATPAEYARAMLRICRELGV